MTLRAVLRRQPSKSPPRKESNLHAMLLSQAARHGASSRRNRLRNRCPNDFPVLIWRHPHTTGAKLPKHTRVGCLRVFACREFWCALHRLVPFLPPDCRSAFLQAGTTHFAGSFPFQCENLGGDPNAPHFRETRKGGVGVEFILGAIPIAFCCRPAERLGVWFWAVHFGGHPKRTVPGS